MRTFREHVVEVYRLEPKVALLADCRRDGEQEISPSRLQCMPGIEEDYGIGASCPVPQPPHRALHRGSVTIVDGFDTKAEPCQRRCNRARVGCGVGQPRRAGVSAVADYERDPRTIGCAHPGEPQE